MSGFALRPYQREAVAAVIAARKAGLRRMLVCLPTGAGKTVIFSHLARLAKRPVLVLAHREELVKQARDKLSRSLGAGERVDIEQGSSRAKPGARAVAASIRSLSPKRLARLRRDFDFGLIIYDECHHALGEDNQRVLRALGAFDEDWTGTLLGVTATTRRGDGKGLIKVFEEIVYSLPLQQMISDGYLAPLRGHRIATAADLREVGVAGDDFIVEELAEVIDIEERNALVARTIQELSRDRRCIAFCVTVAHARHLARALRAVGVAAGTVHGEQKKDARAETLARFRDGALQVVTNVAVLTEGFDDPGVSCIAMARPTRSEGLYAQCIGRGTRLAPGKRDCLILDFADTSTLSLVSLPSLLGMPRDLQLRGGDALEAAEALGRVHAQFPGFEVPPGEITLDEIERRAQSFDPLSREVDPEVRAISANAWVSLGRAGLALICPFKHKSRLSELLVLDKGGRGRRYEVQVDGRPQERFSTLAEAVEAVDYELQRKGRTAGARSSADWRREPTPPELLEALRAARARQLPQRRGPAADLEVVLRHQQRPKAPRKPSLKGRKRQRSTQKT